MLAVTDIIARVRLEIGDPLQPFRSTSLCDGMTQWFDLPNQQISSMAVALVNGSSYTPFTDFSNASIWNSATAYTTGALVILNQFFYQALQNSTNQTPVPGGNAFWSDLTHSGVVVNDELGQFQTGAPPPNNSTLIINGQSWSLFSDTELTYYVTDAVNEHCYNRTITERTYDAFGRIMYRETPVNLSNLPMVEEPLVVALSVINTFWVVANDIATSFNVNTAEGTNIDRTTQYKQVTNQIELMTQRYQEYCAQLNVGMYRAETMQLRRQSLTTGRLVPIFQPAEYDDHRWPTRLLPPIDHRNDDNSGIPSPLWNGNFGGV